MEQSESIKELTIGLSAAQGEFHNIEKTGKGNYGKYAELAPTLELLRPITSKHGLAIVQMPVMLDDGTTGLVTQLSHKSGEWLRCTFPVRMQQQSPQAQGSALTYARRYALSAVMGVAGDDDDGQAGSEGKNPEIKRTVPTKSVYLATPQDKAELKKLMEDKNINSEFMGDFVNSVLGHTKVATKKDFDSVKAALNSTETQYDDDGFELPHLDPEDDPETQAAMEVDNGK